MRGSDLSLALPLSCFDKLRALSHTRLVRCIPVGRVFNEMVGVLVLVA